MRKVITIKEDIFIEATQQIVWDFTQNFNTRKSWDNAILDHEIIQTKPLKLIWLRLRGGISTELIYKLCDKPNKTSLKMHNTKSLFLSGGGGDGGNST